MRMALVSLKKEKTCVARMKQRTGVESGTQLGN